MIIDPKSNTPIYRQIAEQMREAMTAGIYKPGESLPSLRALAMEIRVNPNTVQRAYEELEREGMIESRRGLGVFVVDQSGKLPQGDEESEIVSAFEQGIAQGLQWEISPLRIRELFESTLRTSLAQARKQS